MGGHRFALWVPAFLLSLKLLKLLKRRVSERNLYIEVSALHRGSCVPNEHGWGCQCTVDT